MSTYPMTEEDRRVQETARRFVDEELIPWETHAEEHCGRIPTARSGTTARRSSRPVRDEHAE